MVIRSVLQTEFSRILAGQVLIAILAAGALAWWRGEGAAPAALYGAAVAVAVAWRLQRRLAAIGACPDPVAAVRLIGLAALGRLALAAAAFAVGIGALRLEALPMLSVYAACQLGYPMAAMARV